MSLCLLRATARLVVDRLVTFWIVEVSAESRWVRWRSSRNYVCIGDIAELSIFEAQWSWLLALGAEILRVCSIACSVHQRVSCSVRLLVRRIGYRHVGFHFGGTAAKEWLRDYASARTHAVAVRLTRCACACLLLLAGKNTMQNGPSIFLACGISRVVCCTCRVIVHYEHRWISCKIVSTSCSDSCYLLVISATVYHF